MHVGKLGFTCQLLEMCFVDRRKIFMATDGRTAKRRIELAPGFRTIG